VIAGGLLLLAAAAAILFFVVRRGPARWGDETVMPPQLADAISEFDAGRASSGFQRIDAYRERWYDPLWDRRACDLEAFRAAADGQKPRALAALARRRSFGADPLAVPAAALRADLLLQSGQAAAASAAAAEAGALWPGAAPLRPVALDALETWVRAEIAQGRGSAALETLRRVAESVVPSLSPQALLIQSRLQTESGDTAGAARVLKILWSRWPGSPESEEAMRLLRALPSAAGSWTASDLPLVRDRALALLRQGDEAGSLAAWNLLVSAVPALRSDPRVRTGFGAAYAASGEARRAVAALPQRVSDADLSIELRLARAAIAAAGGRRAVAESLLQPLRAAGVPAHAQARAQILMAEAADRAGAAPASIAAWKTALALLPPGGETDRLRWKAALVAIEARRHDDAISLLRPLDHDGALAGYRSASVFWRARSAEALPRPDEARALYTETVQRFRNDYYGIRAAVRLGQTPAPNGRRDLARATAPGVRDDTPLPVPPAAGAPPAAAAAIQAAAEFELLHLTRSAAPLWEQAAEAVPGRADLQARVADLLLARRDLPAARQAILAAYPGLLSEANPELPRRFAKALCPDEYAPVITSASTAAGLDPHLVAGLILQESVFDPRAVSRAGALGLMQVLPGTGRELARSLGLGAVSRERLFDPGVNVRIGSVHLAALVRQYGGRVEPALAAYNAGAARADRWWAGANGDVERFVEVIPFTETRLYVKRISGNRRLYGLLYGTR